MREMRDIGCRVVSTFVCWDFHERDRSRFVFDASESPLRDLQGFVRAAGDEGLSVILRTGPIIDSERPTRGPAPDVAAMFPDAESVNEALRALVQIARRNGKKAKP